MANRQFECNMRIRSVLALACVLLAFPLQAKRASVEAANDARRDWQRRLLYRIPRRGVPVRRFRPRAIPDTLAV